MIENQKVLYVAVTPVKADLQLEHFQNLNFNRVIESALLHHFSQALTI